MLRLRLVEKEQLCIQVAQHKQSVLDSLTTLIKTGASMHQAHTLLSMYDDQIIILIMITFGMSGLG